MRVLFLLPSVPEPATTGARLRNRALLRAAASSHEVHAVAFGQPDEVRQLQGLAAFAEVVPPPPERTAAQRLRDLARPSLPDLAVRLASDELRACLRHLLARQRYDAIQAEGLEMAPYLAGIAGPARIYDAHNAEFLLQARAARAALVGAPCVQQALLGAYSRVQATRLQRLERALVAQTALTLAVSEHDANQLRALAPGRGRVEVVPNTLDLAAFPLQLHTVREKALLFLGTLTYRPNVEAVAWLVSTVLPRVWVSEPDVRLFVVGAAPPAWLVRLGQHDARIAVTAAVPDERPYLQRTAAMLLPFRAGSGSRLKALVAFASGLPVISTRLGMAGLDAAPDEHYTRAESVEQWVAACLAAVRQPDADRARVRRARLLVEQAYAQPCAEEALCRAYARLAPRGHPA